MLVFSGLGFFPIEFKDNLTVSTLWNTGETGDIYIFVETSYQNIDLSKFDRRVGGGDATKKGVGEHTVAIIAGNVSEIYEKTVNKPVPLLVKLMAYFISKDTSSFTSNTLLIRFPIMLSVYIVYRMHKFIRMIVKMKCYEIPCPRG